MKPVALACLVLALGVLIAACAPPYPDPGDPDAAQIAWPPPPGTTFDSCTGARTGEACTDAGWCQAGIDCNLQSGCYCDGAVYHCFVAEDVCDFGDGAGCALEGNAACGISPVGGWCTCNADAVNCVKSCPLPECPDYNPGLEQCECADGTCP